MSGKLALVAGEGRLPLAILQGLRRRGETDPAVFLLSDDSAPWTDLGCAFKSVKNPLAFGVILTSMRLAGVRRLILAGRVPKKLMYDRKNMDETSRSTLAEASERNDHSLLGAVVRTIERFGIRVVPYEDVVPEMVVSEGQVSSGRPSENEMADAQYGWSVLEKILPLSFGQSLVVADKSVIAVEAMEGTDGMIERAGTLAGRGVLVKGMRRDQDRRYDLPVVGLRTLHKMADAGLTALFLQAGSVLLLDESFVSEADKLGIAVWGVSACQFS